MTNNNKRGIILALILCIFILSLSNVSSVGVRRFSYDVPEFEFQPGLETSINYEVIYASRATVIKATGPFSEYVTITPDKIPFSQKDKKFTVTISIPLDVNSLDFRPGTNSIMLSIDDDFENTINPETGAFVFSTSARTPIRIHVPYPGNYAEFNEFDLPAVNNGLDTSLKFSIWNRGKNDLFNTNYEFVVKDAIGNSLITKTERNIDIPTQDEKFFYISPIESGSLNPGEYMTTLTYYYADKSVSKDYELKVGELNVNLVNHTAQLYNDSIQKFNIFVESDWNDIIASVYASVIINGTETKTTPADLQNFETKMLTAHIDTTLIPLGNHTLEMVLHFGSKSKKEISKIEIIERPVIKESIQINWLVVGLIVVIVLLFGTTIVFIVVFTKKLSNSNNKSKSKKIGDDKKK